MADRTCSLRRKVLYKKSGAYTGEVSAEILQSLGVEYVVLGHSERREYFGENNATLAEKVNIALDYSLTPHLLLW